MSPFVANSVELALVILYHIVNTSGVWYKLGDWQEILVRGNWSPHKILQW